MLARKNLSIDCRFQELPIYKFYKRDREVLHSGVGQYVNLNDCAANLSCAFVNATEPMGSDESRMLLPNRRNHLYCGVILLWVLSAWD